MCLHNKSLSHDAAILLSKKPLISKAHKAHTMQAFGPIRSVFMVYNMRENHPKTLHSVGFMSFSLLHLWGAGAAAQGGVAPLLGLAQYMLPLHTAHHITPSIRALICFGSSTAGMSVCALGAVIYDTIRCPLCA